MEVELRLSCFSCFVRRVASVAAHVERGVPATLLRNIQALLVAGKAKFVPLSPEIGFSNWFLLSLLCGS